jgi:hypothetical protein
MASLKFWLLLDGEIYGERASEKLTSDFYNANSRFFLGELTGDPIFSITIALNSILLLNTVILPNSKIK